MNRVFTIGGRAYNIAAPTIKRISLACKEMESEGIPEGASDFQEMFNDMKKGTLCKVLSLLISGDYSLATELTQGAKDELIEPLCAIYEDIEKDMKGIRQMSRQICLLCAKPKVQ